MKRSFTVGAGKTDITPPLNIPYLGLRPRHRFFKGVHDPLFARSIYMSDGQAESIVVATDTIGLANDLFGPKRNFTAEVRKEIERSTGVMQNNIMLASSHIHSTAETIGIRRLADHPGAVSWLETLKAQLVSSAKLARENTFAATLRIGKGRVDKLFCNRRVAWAGDDDVVDEELLVLLFESRKRDKIFLVNAACHPVILQAQDFVSGDYVGALQTNVERMIDNTRACIFLQGACGDINPTIGDNGDFNEASLMGLSITGEIMKVFGQMGLCGAPTQPVIVKTATRKLVFPSRPLPVKTELKKIKEQAQKGDCLAQETVRRVEQGAGPFEGELQVIRIGNALLVGIPGEPFCQLGLEIKKKSAPFHGIPVGYANGYLGYIAPPKAWKKGAYEVDCGPWSKVSQEGYEMIITAFEHIRKRSFIKAIRE